MQSYIYSIKEKDEANKNQIFWNLVKEVFINKLYNQTKFIDNF